MKTIIAIPIVVIALSMFTIITQAQNVKSVNYTTYKPEKSIGKDKMNLQVIQEELKQYLNKYASFNDEIKMDKINASSLEMEEIRNELMKSARFYPSETSGFREETVNQEMEQIKTDLMTYARYYPSDSNDPMEAVPGDDLKDIKAELAVYAKYKPTAIQD